MPPKDGEAAAKKAAKPRKPKAKPAFGAVVAGDGKDDGGLAAEQARAAAAESRRLVDEALNVGVRGCLSR